MEEILFSDELKKKEWDVIIVGTGMGGAVLGHSLSRAGKSVLFCEKGSSYLKGNIALKGNYAENFLSYSEASMSKRRDILARAGRWFEEIEDNSAGNKRNFIPFIGSGPGGSSALYGMALERFFPIDFTPKRNYPDAEESTLPETWPIGYEDLRPYYEAAELLFRVRGTADPLRGEATDHFISPPPLTPAAEELHNFLINKKLHPYRLPMACEFVSDCECCQGYLCDKNCKNDSTRICLVPALTQFGAKLLDECEVLKLEATRNKITGVICQQRGRRITLRAKIIVLAAGAMETPKILLNSASSEWPHGVANNSGLVGKNLMRHFIDLFAILPNARQRFPVNFKEIAFNDFYIVGDKKFGTVQSFGAMPPPSVITADMEQKLCKGKLPFADSLFRLIKPIVKSFLKSIFSRRIIISTIMEDLPYPDNMVTLSDKTDDFGRRHIVFKYRIRDYDRLRIDAFRHKMKDVLKPYRFILIKQAENNERIAHACGTCRFGLDPKNSVIDAYNRAHELTNLYVVDSSFFPSSGGTNPALTVAANALRVANHLTGILN